MNIKKAQKQGMAIRREVKYYAVDANGITYCLAPDWTYEYLYQWRKMPRKKKRK